MARDAANPSRAKPLEVHATGGRAYRSTTERREQGRRMNHGRPGQPTADDDRAVVEEMVEPEVPARFRWLAGLLAAAPGDRFVDLGCGTAGSLRFVLPALRGGLAVGVDLSPAVLREAARRPRPPGRARLLRADLRRPLPFATASVDRVLCHNVLESLPEPDALVAEAWRVLRPGGRLVLSHSDYDTMVFASEDVALTRRLIRTYGDTQQDWMDAVDGTIGRRLVDIVGRSPLQVADVQARVNLSRSFRPGELGHGYARNLAEVLRGSGQVDPAELDGWLAGLRRLDRRGAFLFSLNDYAVVAVRPTT
jgi:SAM-dependent methyltransferase